MRTNEKTARLNDMLRSQIPLVPKPDLLVMTRGIAALPTDDIADIMEKVRTFKGFNTDNDPYGEHDFGSVEHVGKKVFFKIDDHGGHDGSRLVLTVMLASEY